MVSQLKTEMDWIPHEQCIITKNELKAPFHTLPNMS